MRVCVGVQGVQWAMHIWAGRHHTCAKADGNLGQCWGRGDDGQMGSGGQNQQNAVSNISTIGPVLSIGPGHAHTCAVNVAQEIWCWGEGSLFRLGTGDQSDTPLPLNLSQ